MNQILESSSKKTNSGSRSTPSGRPVNADGTTAWDVIFDDPEKGIITAVRATTSSKQLFDVLSSVVSLLYRRKRDAEPRAEFEGAIAGILKRNGKEDFIFARGEVIRLLEKEKNNRLRKARQYAENKRLSQGIERRKDKASDGLVLGLRPPTLISIGLVTLALLIGLGGFIFLSEGDTRVNSHPTEKSTVSASPEATQAPPVRGKTEPDAKPVVTIPSLILKPTPVTVNHNGRQKAVLVVPVVALRDEDEWEPLCALAPRIAEGIAFAVHASRNEGRELDEIELRRAATGIWRSLSDHPATAMAAGSLALRVAGDLPTRAVAQARDGCARVDLAQK